MHYYIDALRKYFVIRGRASRKEYWMFALFYFIVGIIFVLPDIFLRTDFLFPIYQLAMLIPTVTITVRRLHDIGKSTFWLLICLIPFLGGIVLFIFTILKGQSGANQYGPDPYDNSQQQV